MGELIGHVDAGFVDRNLVRLDQQARLLGSSSLAELLGCAVDLMPGSSFFYSDLVGIHGKYPNGAQPGYVLRRETSSPSPNLPGLIRDRIDLIISSNGKYLELSSSESFANIRYHSHGPKFHPGLDSPYLILQYMDKIALISAKEKPALVSKLAKLSRRTQP